MPRPASLPALNSIGARVRWWREYRKIKRGELAKLVGMGYSTLSDLENELQEGSKYLHLISAQLRLNAHYLQTGKGEPEAEYAQEAPFESAPWPFISIHRAKLHKLNPIERTYLESRMFEALAEIESERKKTRNSG